MKSCFAIFKPCFVFMFLYISIIIGYGFYSYRTNKRDTLRNLDEKLALVATGVKFSLSDDFYDRAVSKDAITKEENHKNVVALSDYAADNNVMRVYTLVKVGRKIFYTASSQQVGDVNNSELDPPFFLSYDEAPSAVFEAFDKLDATYISCSDKWGKTRKVLFPELSSSGNRYLVGVDIDTKQIDAKLQKHLLGSVGISSIFILLAVPFVFLFKKTEKEHVEEFESLKDLLHQRCMDRTTKIERKINEFIDRK